MKDDITVYTDGACSGNPGPGGWAALLQSGAHEKVLSGGVELTTNNRMELTAALEALRSIKQPSRIALHTDSTYLAHAFNEGWLTKWQKNGWKNAKKKPVENKDLWEGLLEQANRHDVRFIKVKGHADDALNNRVDGLAVEAMQAFR